MHESLEIGNFGGADVMGGQRQFDQLAGLRLQRYVATVDQYGMLAKRNTSHALENRLV